MEATLRIPDIFENADRDLGHALGFDVYIAANDRTRPWACGVLADGGLSELPAALANARLLD